MMDLTKQTCLFIIIMVLFADNTHSYNNTDCILSYKIVPPKYQDYKYGFLVIFACKNVNYTCMNSMYTYMNISNVTWHTVDKYTVITTDSQFNTTNLQTNNITEHRNKSVNINTENIAKDFINNQTNRIFIIYGLHKYKNQIGCNCGIEKIRTFTIQVSWQCRKTYQNSTSNTLQGVLYRRLFNYSDFPPEISYMNISTHIIAKNDSISKTKYSNHKNCSIREHIKVWLYDHTSGSNESETCSSNETLVNSLSTTNTALSWTTTLLDSLTSKTTLSSPTGSNSSYTKTSVFPSTLSTGSAGKWYVSSEMYMYITVFSGHYIHIL
uniref:Glycoprotein ORF-Q n=1 Tax=Elephant endotheliotropic herpesvirus 1A TaxID=759753 RepID=A0A866VUX8_ELHV1|nr:glycoprotein ORF-Q [Elephant endotheliotropic herpesvirus 1A]QOE75103.1 glycoprotein ORF-Q [Elephant endotheliotropic herpesvirus 1A]